jgi:hypothetical protein
MASRALAIALAADWGTESKDGSLGWPQHIPMTLVFVSVIGIAQLQYNT